jgi:molybdopterin-containing oxidoreductase family membrane subunit
MATTAQAFDVKQERIPASYLVIAVILALAGIAAWIYQISTGMSVTNLGQQVVWGLYIAAFFTAVGAGASILFLVGVSEFRPILPLTVRTRALSLALAAFIAGGLLITMDVGNPLNLWRLVAGLRFSSMMTWDFWLLVVASLVTLVYLWQARRSQPAKALGWVGILAGIAVVAVEGWMLSVLAARPMWGSGLTLVSFLLGAAVGGLGLGMIFLSARSDQLRTGLAFALWLSLLLVVAEVLTGLLSGEPRTLSEIRLLVAGPTAIIFWFQVVAGLLIPLALLRIGSLTAAGILAVLGVLAEKVWLLAVGQAQPWLDLPQGSYLPSWVEGLAVLGVIAIGWLIYRAVAYFTRRQARRP